MFLPLCLECGAITRVVSSRRHNMELSHTRVLVSDFASCFRFYKDVLGFEVTWGNESSGYADFKTSGTGTFSLFDKAEMAQTVGANQLPPSAQVQDRFVLLFTDDNLDELIPVLEARGARIVNQPKDMPDW